MEILIALLVLCIGSLVHNDLYFRGLSRCNLFVFVKFATTRLEDTGSKHAKYARLWFVLIFVVASPVGLCFLCLDPDSIHIKSDQHKTHWQILKYGWYNFKHDYRKWKYGNRAIERLNRMRKRKG